MRKIIDGLAYDTDKAESIHHWWNGHGQGDFHHLSETLYKTSSGRWFLKYDGGALTEYAEVCAGGKTGSEGIRALQPEEALEWLERHAPAEVFESHFETKEA